MNKDVGVKQFLTLVALLCWSAVATAHELKLKVGAAADPVEMAVTVYPATGRSLLVWLPSDNGLLPADTRIAAALAKRGVEVWLTDALGARFLPVVPSSLEQIPGADVADVVRAAQQKTGKNVYLLGPGRGAVPALAAVRLLQADPKKPLRGVVLISPNLYVGTPDAGEEAKYLPIARQAKSAYYVLQPELSPWRWYLDRLTGEFKASGSRAQIKTLPGVRDRFYYREDGPPAEQAMGKRMPDLIADALKKLN